MSHPDPRWCARLKAGGAGDPSSARPKRVVVDRADFDPAYDPSAPIMCEICGNEMHYTGACKIACGTCGYKRDCSDP